MRHDHRQATIAFDVARLALASLVIVSPYLGPREAAGEATPEEATALKLRALAPAIRAEFSGGQVDNGHGFVVGESDSLYYVVTAGHVVRADKDKEGHALPAILEATKVHVEFQGMAREVDATLLSVKPEGDMDFALLAVKKSDGPSTKPAYPCMVLKESEFTSVAYIGNDIDGAEKWPILSSGKIKRWNIERHLIEADFVNPVVPGSSGGPLLSAIGVDGVISQGGKSILAVPMSDVKAHFETHLDKNFWKLEPCAVVGASSPKLELSAAALQFPDVPRKSNKSERVVLRNKGTSDLVVSAIKFGAGSSSAFSVESGPPSAWAPGCAVQGPFTIPPGGQCIAVVKFVPTLQNVSTWSRDEDGAPLFDGTASIASNDPTNRNAEIKLKGSLWALKHVLLGPTKCLRSMPKGEVDCFIEGIVALESGNKANVHLLFDGDQSRASTSATSVTSLESLSPYLEGGFNFNSNTPDEVTCSPKRALDPDANTITLALVFVAEDRRKIFATTSPLLPMPD